MEKHWLRRDGADRLVIFALGWSADHAVVEHIDPAGCDVLCLYDYREFAPFTEAERAQIEGYREKYLFAWSFGVMVSEHLFRDVAFTRAVAFNGTPWPLDDRFGIGQKRFMVTQHGLMRAGMDEFDKRVYGNSYERLKGRLSTRGLIANVNELTALKKLSYALTIPTPVRWNKAVVGEFDVISPPQNMLDYWQERAEFLPLPHYPFADANIILREIDH